MEACDVKVILLDSGTTNSRLRLVEATTNTVIDTEKIRVGVRDSAISGSNQNLKVQLKEGIKRLLMKTKCMPADIHVIVASGMITSNLGIYEVPHISSPAGVSQFAGHSVVCKLEEFLSIPCLFIPGMKNEVDEDDLVFSINEFDVMRGEEVESFGLLKQFPNEGKGLIVLPGSHTKFVFVGENKELLYCLSTLGGETLQALQKETILSNSLDSSLIETVDQKMLTYGFEAAKQYGLTRSFYHIRLLDLFTKCNANQRANYLAGSVIFNDLQALSGIVLNEIKWVIVGGISPLRKAFTHLLTYINQGWKIIEADDQQVENSLLVGAMEILANYGSLKDLIGGETFED